MKRYEADREHAPQQEPASALGTDRGTASGTEHRTDLLPSTLGEYLAAAGMQHSRIVGEKDGVEICLDLDTFTNRRLDCDDGRPPFSGVSPMGPDLLEHRGQVAIRCSATNVDISRQTGIIDP